MSGQLVHVPFRLGLEEGSDPKNLPPGQLVIAENVRADKAGRLSKRYGTSGLVQTKAAGGSISVGQRLVPRGDFVGMSDADYLHSYSTTHAKWTQHAQLPQYLTAWDTIVDTIGGASTWDALYLDGYEIYAWVAGDPWGTPTGAVFYVIRDSRSGAIVCPPTAIGYTAINVRLVAGTNAVYLVSALSAMLRVSTLQPNTGTVTGTTTLETDVATSGAFDAIKVGTTLVVAYNWTGANPKLQFRAWTLDTWGAAVATGSMTGETAAFQAPIALATGGTDDIYVAWGQSTAVETRIATINRSTLAVVNGILAADTVTGRSIGLTWLTTGQCLLTWGDSSIPRAISCVYLSAAGGSMSTTTKRGTAGAWWSSKPLAYDGRYFAVMTCTAYRSGSQLEQYATALVEIETSAKVQDYHPHRHVSTVDVGIGGMARYPSSPSAGHLDVDGNAVFLSPFQSTVSTTRANARQGLRRVLMRAPTTDDDFCKPVDVGPTTFVGAGVLSTWDGARFEPYGFLHPPGIISVTPGGGGSGSMAAGAYLYSAVYEYRDAAGVLHRSAPATPVSATAVATGSVVVRITSACLNHHERDLSAAATAANRSVTIAVYRTAVDGTTLYRLTVDPNYNVVTNDPFTGYVDFTDTVADADIGGGVALTSRPQIYTVGGVLESDPCPSPLTAVTHQGRVFALAGDSRSVWATQDVRDDATVAPGFNVALQVPLLQKKRALLSMDDKLVALGEDDLEVILGDGPAANGIGGGWTVVKVQTDVGCINPRSVVSTPMGVIFQSRRGMELLNRGLGVQYIGASVEDVLASFPDITSAVLVARDSEIRWTCNASNGATGVVLVFDYLNKAWFVRKYQDGNTASAPFVDAAMVDGTYTLLTPGGKVYQESTATHLDAGTTWVTMRVRMAWLNPAGPLGWHRVSELHLLGTSATNHDLSIALARDYNATAFHTKSFTAGGAVTATGSLETCRIAPTIQKLQALQVTLTDATPTSPGAYPVTTGQGPILEGIALRITRKPGGARRAATKQA